MNACPNPAAVVIMCSLSLVIEVWFLVMMLTMWLLWHAKRWELKQGLTFACLVAMQLIVLVTLVCGSYDQSLQSDTCQVQWDAFKGIHLAKLCFVGEWKRLFELQQKNFIVSTHMNSTCQTCVLGSSNDVRHITATFYHHSDYPN